MKKEITEITFADGTKGTITTETIIGRVDVKAVYNNVIEYYYTEKTDKGWSVKYCNYGWCNDASEIVVTKTRKLAIDLIMQIVREKQTKTEDDIQTPSDEPKTEEEEEAAAEHFVKQMSDMGEVDSCIYFIDEMHNLFLEIICGVETDEISIERQLIEKCYLPDIKNRPEYIFDTLLSYTYMFELQELLLEMKMKSYVKEIEKYLVLVRRDLLYKIKDPEKTFLAFCKDMAYLTERIIADYFKGGENNDNP